MNIISLVILMGPESLLLLTNSMLASISSFSLAAIPLFINALESNKPPVIFGDGLQTRDFVFVKDVVKANMLAVESKLAVGGIFNIAGDGPIIVGYDGSGVGIISRIRICRPESISHTHNRFSR